MRFSIITLVGLSLLLGSSASHAVVIYDEASSGDLETLDSIVLSLSGGTNSVLGSSSNTNTNADHDGFQISLGAGLVLTSVDYFISNLSVSSDTDIFSTAYTLDSGTYGGSPLDQTQIDLLDASPQTLFDAALPLVGTSSFGITPGVLNRRGAGGTWDYEIRFTVNGGPVGSVPEPSVLALMGIGLAGIGFARRKKA